MTWLTMSDAKELKIDVIQFSLSQPEWAWAKAALDSHQASNPK
jgi:hypothetical protein